MRCDALWWWPPQPTTARCAALGEALRAAVQDFPDDRRVAVIGSGGPSHRLPSVVTGRSMSAPTCTTRSRWNS
ncbi:DODA-type extradiol aromatic ring-opening family dioxygenase [Actinomadura montaniterrae]|uniref:DODA-type extradiol aromatic ring-opening family dioxygenase n=1 Tax=Actinomadura montaniterrae TaxID=1803903 RepID=UPI001CEF7A6F